MICTRRTCFFLLGSGLRAAPTGTAEIAALSEKWRRIVTATDGTVGAAAMNLQSGQHAAWHGDERFPMASVCKLPIAANILAMVDEGKLRLDQSIEIPPRDIYPEVSDIAKRWPKQTRFPLTEMLELMVAHSDNTAVETFFRIGGGAAGMAARFREWKVEGIRVDRGEEQITFDAVEAHYPPREQWTGEMFKRLMKPATPADRKRGMERYLADPRDTSTPNGMVRLIARAFRGELLSQASTARLFEILKATTTGPKRLKGLLPEGTVVAHKTGTWGTVNGLNGATNDAGVIFLPKGAIALAVFVKGSTRDEVVRDRVIAEMARAAYDFWG